MTNLSTIDGQRKQEIAKITEAVLMEGDLRALSPEMRIKYYFQQCESLGLNPLSKPFEYLTLDNKLVLYPKKECANQLARIHGISFSQPSINIDNEQGLITVTVSAKDKRGRTDSDVGVVSLFAYKRDGSQYKIDITNAIKKAVTQAKRRTIFSMVGLSAPDEDYFLEKAEIIPDEIAETLPVVKPPKEEFNKENADRIRLVREALGVDVQLVKDYLSRYGKNSPVYLSKNQCDDLVMAIAAHAVGQFLTHEEAVKSYQVEVPRLILGGETEAVAIKQWVDGVMLSAFESQGEEVE